MKSTVILFAFILVIILSHTGCGGGGNSSENEVPKSISSSPSNTDNTSLNGTVNSLEIDPLLELGLAKGENICFGIKAYSNISKSKLSEAICTTVMNDEPILLSWNQLPQNIIGYEIYYGKMKKSVTNFFHDVMVL